MDASGLFLCLALSSMSEESRYESFAVVFLIGSLTILLAYGQVLRCQGQTQGHYPGRRTSNASTSTDW